METNFYVGQEVVAIRDHSKGAFKKGDEFVIQGVKKGCCCLELNVGIKTNHSLMKCRYCGKITANDNYYQASSFAPKQQLSETTYNDVQEWIKQGKELAILN